MTPSLTSSTSPDIAPGAVLKVRAQQVVTHTLSPERLGVALLLALALHLAVLASVWLSLPARPDALPALQVRLLTAAGLDSITASDQGPGPQTASAPAAGQDQALASLPPSTEPPTPTARIADAQAATAGERPAATGKAPASAAPSADPASGTSAARIHDYADLSRAIAASGLAETQASRTRRISSASSLTNLESAYLDMWRQKVERIGAANYPTQVSGSLRLAVVIRDDGALEAARILESSGIEALDEAALRIVHLAAPYAQFPTDMRKSTDRLEITRTWRFSRRGAQIGG